MKNANEMISQTIAHYRITGKLGQGGMGEVYRATDTRLDREVAIKVLPESFAEDVNRLARFQREAKVLATLNHPNIAVIHGIEQSAHAQALVMELVEGETLGERLKREPMTVLEALDCCRQIAEALEAAHEKGIIHRDLKPENIKIDDAGRVKVLDFGLAKEVVDPASAENQGESPTLTHMTTLPGELLGTAPYMSPEQARARTVDKRSDIWAFGCVLYECLTGKAMFAGEDVTETLATIIKGEPDWAALPEETPPTIELLLRKCLVKDRKRRLRDIGDARIDIEQALGDPSSSIIRLSDRALQQALARTGLQWKWVVASVVGAAILTAHLTWFIKPIPLTEPRVPKQSDILVSGSNPFTTLGTSNAFDLSPDGKILVYNLSDQGQGLRRRNLVTRHDDPIRGATDPLEGHPFLSWDGSQLGCVLGSELVTIPLAGGTPRKLGVSGINFYTFAGADWGESGHIVFATVPGPLRMVSAEGGDTHMITELGGDWSHGFPQFLPDGDHVLYTAISFESGTPVVRAMVVSLTTGKGHDLGIENSGFIRYCPSGHLLYAVENEIFAVAFDLDRLTVSGSAKRVLEGVYTNARAQFDVAEDGTLVYLPVSTTTGGQKTLVWLDREGHMEPFTGKRGDWKNFALSPDERRVALEIDQDIWILDKLGDDFEQLRPLIAGESVDSHPLWSPDGAFVYFYSDRDGKRAVWKKRTDFSGAPAELICETQSLEITPDSVSANYLLMTVLDANINVDIWKLNISDTTKAARPLFNESYMEVGAMISPDERWVLYSAFEANVGYNVFLKSIDGTGRAMLVSDDQGVGAKWSRTGEEIFYSRSTTIYSVSVTEQGGQLTLTKPKALFTSPLVQDLGMWTVSRDGLRFLMLADAAAIDPEDPKSKEPTHLRMIYNWFTELNEQVPTGKD